MRTFEHYEKEIIESIKKHNIFTQNMIFTFYTGISRAQYFEIKLNESDYIKNALDDNKNRTKQSMLNKWYKSDNPTLQMGLMKLIGSDEEAHRLNGSSQKIDHTTGGEKITWNEQRTYDTNDKTDKGS